MNTLESILKELISARVEQLAHEAEQHPAVLAQLARRVWETDDMGCFDQETAQAGVRAFAEFLRELELPTEDSELDDALWCHLKESASAQNLLVYTA